MVEITRVCANTGCENPGKHLCSGCGEEIYCSKECQKAHWAKHKLACKSAVKPEAAMFIKSFDQLSVKQLKNIIIAKATTFEASKKNKILKRVEQTVEKPALVKLVKDHVQPEEIEALLTTPASAKVEAASSSGTASARSAKNKNVQQRATFEEVEKMSKLSADDRGLLQQIQEGLTGVKPIDDAWITMIIDALKKKPEVFKTLFKGKGAMFGGVSDEQVEGFIDMAHRMDKWMLKLIAYAIWYVSSAAKPLAEIYKKVDEYTFGTARYILMGLFAMIMYYVAIFSFAVVKWIALKLYGLVLFLMKPGAAKVVEQATQQAATTVEGEFADAAAATIGKVSAAAAAAKASQAAFSGNTNVPPVQAKAAAGGASNAQDEFEF
eukprot:gene878-931_t